MLLLVQLPVGVEVTARHTCTPTRPVRKIHIAWTPWRGAAWRAPRRACSGLQEGRGGSIPVSHVVYTSALCSEFRAAAATLQLGGQRLRFFPKKKKRRGFLFCFCCCNFVLAKKRNQNRAQRVKRCVVVTFWSWLFAPADLEPNLPSWQSHSANLSRYGWSIKSHAL